MALINRSTAIEPLGDRNNPLNTAEIFFGNARDCAEVFADVDNNVSRYPTAVGSWYLSNGTVEGSTIPPLGAMYLKITNAGAATDWVQIVTAPCRRET